MSMDKMQGVFLALLSVTGVISVLAFWNWSGKRSERRQSRWPSTEGTVTVSESVWKNTNPIGDGPGGIDILATKVRFSYKVGDTVYSGEQKWADSGSFGFPQAGKYPAGTKVTIYYNINNPADAVIERTISASKGQGWLDFLMGVVLLLSLGFFVVGITVNN
ncbi:MAG: DUF3592 domain-containing protein [Chloroflexi bacterium]|nr:DUF3592 domain-containing protein [Chloroflexota bacterium]